MIRTTRQAVHDFTSDEHVVLSSWFGGHTSESNHVQPEVIAALERLGFEEPVPHLYTRHQAAIASVLLEASRAKAFKLVRHDKKLVRFYLPLEPKKPEDPVWSVIRTLSNRIGEQLTTHLRAIADANPLLKGIIDRVMHGRRSRGKVGGS